MSVSTSNIFSANCHELFCHAWVHIMRWILLQARIVMVVLLGYDRCGESMIGMKMGL
jgi:hypothetical protein